MQRSAGRLVLPGMPITGLMTMPSRSTVGTSRGLVRGWAREGTDPSPLQRHAFRRSSRPMVLG